MNKHLRVFAACCLTLFILLFSKINLRASHAMGADLSYQCINASTNTYRITLKFYRDCAGIDAPLTATLNLESQTCGQSFTAELLQEPCPPAVNGGTPCEVSPLCFASIAQSTCNGGNLPGVQAYTYTADVTLPQQCTDWTMSISINARNDQITNLVNANAEDLYVETTLNNVAAVCNNSPVFTTLPVPYICANQPFFYNHGAVDVDGDSLVYSLINPLGANATPIGYAGGFSPTVPMNLVGLFNFSTQTGQMSFTPNGIQVAVITVLVEEYRNGVLIGTTIRDIQMVVVSLPGCANPTPSFSGAIQPTVVGGIYISPDIVQVCPGTSLTFSTLAIEGSNDSIFVESNVAQAIPTAQYTTQYVSADSVFGYFSWTPTGLDTGQNTFIVNIKNNHCPLASSQAFAVTIDVLAGTIAGPDVSYCPAGGPVQLQAFGGSQFSWTPSAGLDNANIGNPQASPVQTTTYVVTSNLSSNCRNTDTITVFRVPDFNYTISQSDDTICRFEFVDIEVIPDAGFGPYTYQWTPDASLNSGTVSNPVAQPDYTTVYTLVITSDTGCVIRDTTLKVVVEGQGPAVNITADKYNVCVGDTIQLNTSISQLPCGLNVIPCTGNFALHNLGTGNVSGHSPYHGLYEDARMQLLIRASELQALGMTAGTITDIAFDVSSVASTSPYTDFTIRMGCTDLTQLAGFVPGLSTVMVDPAYSVTVGSNNHTFNTPYDWDGYSNLIIDICFNNNSWTATDNVNATNTGYPSVAYDFLDNATGCLLNTPATDVYRPNIQFVYCQAVPKPITYQWTPTTGVFSADSLSPTVVLQQSTTYYLTANDGSCSGGSSVTLNIDTGFGVTAGPDVPFCAGTPVQLAGSVYGNLPTGSEAFCGLSGPVCGIGSGVQKTFTPSGTFSSNITPFDGGILNTVEDQRTQILYKAADLIAKGFSAGPISQFGLKITAKNNVFPNQNFNIKMGCTLKAELDDNGWEPTTLVYTNPSLTTVIGWNDWNLNNAYSWDGVSNLVVELCWDNPDGLVSFGQDFVSAATPNYYAYHSTFAQAQTVGCNIGTPTFELYFLLPEMRMRMCPPATLPVTYQWTPATSLSSDTAAMPFASPASPTMYYLTALFGGKCAQTDSVLVTPNNVSITVSNDTTICLGTSAQLNITGATDYNWTPATELTCSNCSSPVASPDSGTYYFVQASDSVTGCSINDTVFISVVSVNATALFTDTLVDQGTPLTLVVDGQSSGNLSYLWTPSTYLNDANSSSPISTPLQDILYNAIVSSSGCADTAQVNVRVRIIESPVAIPNAFTPNGDGKNDLFYPVITNAIASVKDFRIYNRYGQLVHNSTFGWNGQFKSTDQPAGTFVYYLVIERPGKEDEKFQGSVTLIR